MNNFGPMAIVVLKKYTVLQLVLSQEGVCVSWVVV